MDDRFDLDQEKDSVLRQLDRILTSSHFKASKNSMAFLRHVVERSLEGDDASLKERVIGSEVFGRRPDYDSNSDPVVRITAGEVRKRLALYYRNAETAAEVLITLPVGTYRPQFETPEKSLELVSIPASPLVPVPKHTPSNALRSGPWILTAGIAVWLAIGAFALLKPILSPRKQTALDDFWAPLIESPLPAIISTGSISLPAPPGQTRQGTVQEHLLTVQLIPVSTGGVASQTIAHLTQHEKKFDFQASERVTFYDLQRGPSILAGDPNDPWVARFTEDLPYHFVRPDANTLRIEDRAHPEKTAWTLHTDMPYESLTRDFGIVARLSDPKTNQTIVIASGLGEKGIMAAGRFLHQANFFNSQMSDSRKTWAARKNVEIVLSTEVIRGISGPPVVVAVQSW